MKAFRILCILAVSSALFSCAKEELPDAPAPSQEETDIPEGFEAKTFSASISELTKAAFTGTKVNWEETDRIAVYDGTCRNEFKIRSVENGMAIFEGAVTEGAEEFYFPFRERAETTVQRMTELLNGDREIKQILVPMELIRYQSQQKEIAANG